MPTARFSCRIIAWTLLAGIIAVTVSPIGWRPEFGYGPDVDRLVGFLLMGLFFGVGYGRHWVSILALVVLSAFAIEMLQLLTPDRHARIADALIKSVGGGTGFLLGHVALTLWPKLGQ